MGGLPFIKVGRQAEDAMNGAIWRVENGSAGAGKVRHATVNGLV